jgi:hypothetical protein
MVDDPFFSAHFPIAHSLIDSQTVNETDALFAADQEVTGLGCVEQFQFCVPRLGLQNVIRGLPCLSRGSKFAAVLSRQAWIAILPL